jgi:hypothetical protein
MLLCLLAGCWQEIEYRDSDPVSSQQAQASDTGQEPADQTPTRMAEPASFSESGDRRDVPLADASTTGTPNPIETKQLPTTDAETQTVPAAVEDVLPPESVNTRRTAWILGSNFSLAALAHGRGIAADKVPVWFQDARDAAETLGTSLAELPERPAASDSETTSHQMLSFLFDQGKQIRDDLTTRHGIDHAALFDVAVKSNLLLVHYAPGSSAASQISTSIAEASPHAKLPEDLWRPLLDMIAGGEPPAAVRTAVRKMHADVENHLSAAVEQ